MTQSIVYVLGHGRSGSTVLDMTLAERLNGISLGQFVGLAQMVSRSDHDRCSCGESLSNCPRWAPVVSSERNNLSSYIGNPFFLRGDRFKQAVRVIARCAGRFAPPDEVACDHQRQLLAGIPTLGSNRIFVDSSKNINRFIALQSLPQTRVHTVFLMRDLAGVIASKRKVKSARRAGTVMAAASWAYQNLLCAILFRTTDGPKVFVRFEELIIDPERTLACIVKSAQIPTESQGIAAPSGSNSGALHMASGNSIRLDAKNTIDRSRTTAQDASRSSAMSALEHTLGRLVERCVLRIVRGKSR